MLMCVCVLYRSCVQRNFCYFCDIDAWCNDANADVLYVDMYKDKHPGD